MRVTNLQTKPTDQCSKTSKLCKLQQREPELKRTQLLKSRDGEIVKSVACGARTEFQVENTLCRLWVSSPPAVMLLHSHGPQDHSKRKRRTT